MLGHLSYQGSSTITRYSFPRAKRTGLRQDVPSVPGVMGCEQGGSDQARSRFAQATRRHVEVGEFPTLELCRDVALALLGLS